MQHFTWGPAILPAGKTTMRSCLLLVCGYNYGLCAALCSIIQLDGGQGRELPKVLACCWHHRTIPASDKALEVLHPIISYLNCIITAARKLFVVRTIVLLICEEKPLEAGDGSDHKSTASSNTTSKGIYDSHYCLTVRCSRGVRSLLPHKTDIFRLST